MVDLKYILVIGFVAVVCILGWIGRSMLHDVKNRLFEHTPNHKIKTILDIHARVISQSTYKSALEITITENYLYILDIIHNRKDKMLVHPVPYIDLVEQEVLREEILPHLKNQVYYELEPMDVTLLRLIEYYNTEMEEILSVAELLVLVIRLSPPSMYNKDTRIIDQVFY